MSPWGKFIPCCLSFCRNLILLRKDFLGLPMSSWGKFIPCCLVWTIIIVLPRFNRYFRATKYPIKMTGSNQHHSGFYWWIQIWYISFLIPPIIRALTLKGPGFWPISPPPEGGWNPPPLRSRKPIEEISGVGCWWLARTLLSPLVQKSTNIPCMTSQFWLRNVMAFYSR